MILSKTFKNTSIKGSGNMYSFYSIKNGKEIKTYSYLDHLAGCILEFDDSTKSFSNEGIDNINFEHNGKEIIFRPNFRCLKEKGEELIIIEKISKLTRNGMLVNESKMAHAKKINKKFILLLDEDILQQPRLNNISRIRKEIFKNSKISKKDKKALKVISRIESISAEELTSLSSLTKEESLKSLIHLTSMGLISFQISTELNTKTIFSLK